MYPIKGVTCTLDEIDIKRVFSNRSELVICDMKYRHNDVWVVTLYNSSTNCMEYYNVYPDKSLLTLYPGDKNRNLSLFNTIESISQLLSDQHSVEPWMTWLDETFCKKCDTVTRRVKSSFGYEFDQDCSPCEISSDKCPYRIHSLNLKEIIELWLTAAKE